MVDKTVFVTVGTTEFDLLLETITRNEILELLVEKGYTRLILQKGRGTFKMTDIKQDKLLIECYDYKDSIAQDLQNASLVVSHAGAGSILETLSLKKPLIVVVNERLMDNHQYELAEKMAHEGYLFYCACATLKETLQKKNLSKLKHMKPTKPRTFSNYVDGIMGVCGS